MSKDLNNCMFIGRLGKDIDAKSTTNGSTVANFSIACSDDYKDKSGQKVEQTNWINIVMFGKLAEIAAEFLKKGAQVYISGKQVTRKWQDKDGNDRYSTEVVANELQMLGGKSEGSAPSQPAKAASAPVGGGDPDFDSIPFAPVDHRTA